VQTNQTTAAPEIELLPINGALIQCGGISRNHFYDLIRKGLMPKPVKLGSQCSRWVKAELVAAIAALAAKRNTHQ
jgi:predicted DNA-binding transcriptional regulator AlpA